MVTTDQAHGGLTAVAGAVMAIGLKKERGDTIEDWLRISAVAQEFRRRFEVEMGTINCRELTWADLSTEEGLKQYMRSDTPDGLLSGGRPSLPAGDGPAKGNLVVRW